MSLERIAIYGAGGFGREAKFLLDCINRPGQRYEFMGFLDDQPKAGTALARPGTFENVAIAIALPASRRDVFSKCGDVFKYPALIHPDVTLDPSVRCGRGLVICAGVKITVDVQLDEFAIVNLNATIGHDVKIGAFTSIMPAVNISGNVTIGREVFIGAGATILQGLTVGDRAVIGAGAVVTKDVPRGAVAKGVPAKF